MGTMFKKVAGLIFLLLFACSGFAFAAPQPTKHIVLFYKVSDAILMCQNSDENIEKGKIEFENELNNHYSKRFVVDGVKYLPEMPALSAEEYLAMVKQNETPFILKLKLNGTGSTIQTFQNVFGAKKSIEVPTIKIDRAEAVVDRQDKIIYAVNYGEAEYHPNAMALGGDLYSSTDQRKNTKNDVRGYIRDYCTYLGDKINKYADMKKFNQYNDAYNGDFKQILLTKFSINPNKPYLGVDFSYDLIIKSLTPDFPMTKAGFIVGDKIVAINSVKVENKTDFIGAFDKCKPGINITFVIVRNGQEKVLNVVPEARSVDIFRNVKV